MPFTNFPNGLTSFGIPLLGGGQLSIPNRPNQIFFVDQTGAFSTTGNQSFTAIQDAINACSDDAGATVFVFPGSYDENLVIPAGLNYLSLIGAQIPGYARPDIVPSTGIALSNAASQGLVLQHLRFAGTDADVVVQRGNGFLFDDCVFDGDAGMAATEAALRLVPSDTDDSFSASEGIIQRSLFRGTSVGAGIIMQHAIAAGGGEGTSDNQILGCRFYDNGVDLLSAVAASGGGAGIYLRLLCAGNFFMQNGAAYVYANLSAGVAGDLAANSGLFCNNWFADDALIAAQFNIAGQPKVFFSGNYAAPGLVDGSTFNN
jgi:hypothetical protein